MLTLTNVSKRFRKREVLKDISLQFDRGCYGLLGPNGEAKRHYCDVFLACIR